MKIRELIELLQKQDQEATVAIAPTPDVMPAISHILPHVGSTTVDGQKYVVLGPMEDTICDGEGNFEHDIAWNERPI